MRAECVSVGTELLLGHTVDTNAAALGQFLAALGIGHTHRQTVGDNLGRLAEALRTALARSDIVFTIGGLGPTEDDLTREAIAEALGDPLIEDPKIAEQLRSLFAARGLKWVDSQLRQAQRPGGAVPLPNPNGSAPGLLCRQGEKTVIALPGPPGEFRPMLEGPVADALRGLGAEGVIHSRTVRTAGVGESIVEGHVRDLVTGTDPTVATYARVGEVALRVTARAQTREAAEAKVQPVVEEIERRMGEAVYGRDDVTLEAALLARMRRLGATLAVAESCTGGLLGGRVTSAPGASDVFLGGVTSYADTVKAGLLGVSEATLRSDGAVSAACAREMAQGARRATGASHALSVTGIAGPGGGTVGSPAGQVYIGVATPDGVEAHGFQFRGDRENVRAHSVAAALLLLWRAVA